MDPRRARTIAALHRAVLQLTQQHALADITAQQVADAANVNRATYFRHVTSLEELLADALRDEFDEARARLLQAETQHPSRDDLLTDGLTWIAEHTLRYERVYRDVLVGGGIPVLLDLIASHLRDTVRQAMELAPASGVTPPGVLTKHAAAYNAARANFAAYGAIGVTQVWLSQPAPHDPTFYVETVRACVAGWWGEPGPHPTSGV